MEYDMPKTAELEPAVIEEYKFLLRWLKKSREKLARAAAREALDGNYCEAYEFNVGVETFQNVIVAVRLRAGRAIDVGEETDLPVRG